MKTDKPNQAYKTLAGQGIAAPQGFWATGVKAGVKYRDRYDVALIYSECPAAAAGVFTRNAVQAHPVRLSCRHLADGRAQAIVANSGNANACYGAAGDQAALAMAVTAARALDIPVEDVVVASTGVIGQALPADKVLPGIRMAAEEILAAAVNAADTGKSPEAIDQNSQARQEQAHRAALAIMTTDLAIKEAAYELQCRNGRIRLGIIAKGSGMIHPNMGTLLGFITTDACLEADELQDLLREATDASFNMVTVDGDTSTNDMVAALANGRSGVRPEGEEEDAFRAMFIEACTGMAQAIARDGEGASKFVEVRVTGAATQDQARTIAKTVCGSNLVKCALYGGDANWGRILCAVGYAGVPVDPETVDIYLNGLQVAARGRHSPFDEDEAGRLLREPNIEIAIVLRSGTAEATAWGCDLTHKYIDINADYRS